MNDRTASIRIPTPTLTRLASLLPALFVLSACGDASSTVEPRPAPHERAADRAPAPTDFDVALPNVALSSGGHANLVASVFVSPRSGPPCDATGTVLAVTGFAHS